MPNPSEPQDFNGYSYVHNSPVKYIDPSGHADTRPPMIDGVCASPEGCLWEPPPPESSEFYPPFSDEVDGTWRHLVETCSWTECSAVMFNAYTPGIWHFQAANLYHLGTVDVYAEGPVSLDDALQAAEEGHPNPLSDEQLNEGLKKGTDSYPGVSVHLMAVKNHFWFAQLFVEQFGWDVREAGRSANFEPRYLHALVTNTQHKEAVERTWGQVIKLYEEDPAVFETLLQWGHASSR